MNGREHRTNDGTSPIRVVIVDDSHEVRYLLAMLLETDGRFQVVGEAEQAKAGLAAVAEAWPDLVVVDLRLGGRDGLWLLRELRSRHRHPALAVVTGSSTAHTVAAAFAAGADAVLSKDSASSTMADELADCVAARSATVSV